MQVFCIEKVIAQDGQIQLDELPFLAGETVQVIILPSRRSEMENGHHVLKDSVIDYIDPFTPVAQDDWDVLQ